MTQWTTIAKTDEKYSHGESEFKFKFIIQKDKLDQTHEENKVTVKVYKLIPVLWGFLHDTKEIGASTKLTNTSELPEAIEELRREAKRISDEYAQELEAVNRAIAD